MPPANGSERANRKRPVGKFGEEDGLSNKKVRFDVRNPSTLAADEEEEDDAILGMDEIGRRGRQTKRNAVNIDGYDSDSDNDNFNARAAAKAKAEKATKSGGDIDMFADPNQNAGDDEDVENVSLWKKKDKEVRFLAEDEIEGQDEESKSGGHIGSITNPHEDEHESSSDSGDDAERDRIPDNIDKELGAGAKKKHAPLIDAFNMRNENEEGRFDQNGNFIHNAADPNDKYDQWLEGISRKDRKNAAEAKAKREEDEKNRVRDEDSNLMSNLLTTFLTHVRKGERTVDALGRLEKGMRYLFSNIPSILATIHWKQRAGMKAYLILERKKSDEYKRITATDEELADAMVEMMRRGHNDIYEYQREKFVRMYKKETGEDWVDAPVMWEFYWVNAEDDSVHGPYDSQTMQSWKDNSYFDDYSARFRRVGDSAWEWDVDIF